MATPCSLIINASRINVSNIVLNIATDGIFTKACLTSGSCHLISGSKQAYLFYIYSLLMLAVDNLLPPAYPCMTPLREISFKKLPMVFNALGDRWFSI